MKEHNHMCLKVCKPVETAQLQVRKVCKPDEAAQVVICMPDEAAWKHEVC